MDYSSLIFFFLSGVSQHKAGISKQRREICLYFFSTYYPGLFVFHIVSCLASPYVCAYTKGFISVKGSQDCKDVIGSRMEPIVGGEKKDSRSQENINGLLSP